jgi:HlyD family secretion protein
MTADPTPVNAAQPQQSLHDLIAREKVRAHRRGLIGLAVIVCACLVGLLVWRVARAKPVPLAARFRSQVTARGDVVQEVRATGHVEAVTTVQVGAEISGRIASVEVDYNATVTEGQVLARFDRAALAAQLAQTAANLAVARAELEQNRIERARTERDASRAKLLQKSRAITDAELDTSMSAARLAVQRVSGAEAQLAAQQALFSIARTNLDHSVIRSPIAGVVITRNVDPGQTVAAMLATPVLFTVAADLRKTRVVAAIDEADIGSIALAQPGYFTVNAYPGRTFEGVVTEVRNSPVVVQDVVTYAAVVEVDNLDLALKPGMTASVRVRIASAQRVLRVPTPALRFTPPGERASDKPALWVLAGTNLRRIDVLAGISDGEFTAIEGAAVAEGQPVLTDLTPEGRKAYGVAH